MGRAIHQNNQVQNNQVQGVEALLPPAANTPVLPPPPSVQSGAQATQNNYRPDYFGITLGETPNFKKYYDSLDPQKQNEIKSLCSQRSPVEMEGIFQVLGSQEYQKLDDRSKSGVQHLIQKLDFNDLGDIGWRVKNYTINPNVKLEDPKNLNVAEIVAILYPSTEQAGGRSATGLKGSAEAVPAAERNRYERLCVSRSPGESEAIAGILCSEPYKFLNEATRENFTSQISSMNSRDLMDLHNRLGQVAIGNYSGFDSTSRSKAGAALDTMFAHLTQLPLGFENCGANRSNEDRLAISGILNSNAFKKSSPAEKQQLAGIIEASDTKSLWALSALNDTLGKGGTATMLLSKDSQGQTMLSSLHDLFLTKTVIGPDLANNFAELKRETLNAIANPGLVCQGSKRTCAATDPMRNFLSDDPPEMARIIRDLALTGSAKFRDGKIAPIKSDALAEDNSRRTIVERMVQSTFMDFANGSKTYDNSTDNSYNGSKPNQPGLASEEQAVLMSSFYGRKFNVMRGTPDQMVQAIENRTDRVVTSLRWNDAGGEHRYHSVSVFLIAGNSVIISNPWGREIGDSGSSGPKRSLLWPAEGMEEMDLNEFKGRLASVILPAKNK